ncbi:testis-expressed protein 15-like [Ctenodactylus gundi]
MEMKTVAKQKTLQNMSSTCEPLVTVEVSSLRKFTIPKIRRTTEKVYFSSCCTSTREYSFIHETLNQGRLDVSCDLQSSWQFGNTKLIHNEVLEKEFTAKRSEMRENGRHGRELEEHFCFLALPHSDVEDIYQNGLTTKTSTLKILGNPLLGIYVFRHVDVALNYALSQSITVESIIIFKVLFGKVKKIQPSMDKNKVSLDPSPNFDCHMSRSTPSLKDTIELQAYSSLVYFYEYNVFLKPVDKPRQCLPYAVVTVKFISRKVDNGHLMTSSKFFSRFPKRPERTCSLNNCTVAKRIGKGKDATVIFEHFRKPVDPFSKESCSCSAQNSETNPSSSCSSCRNVQNGDISIPETYECLSQKDPHHSLEYEDSIHTSFTLTQKLMEMKLEKTNQNCVSIITDAFQEGKDFPQIEELISETVISSHAVETAFDNSQDNITTEDTCDQTKNENGPVSLESVQKDCKEITYTEDEGQDHILSCNTQLSDNKYLNIHLKGQGENDKEKQNKVKENSSGSPPENNIEEIHEQERQEFYTDSTFTNIEERKENKNDDKVKILSSEEFPTKFNLVWEEKEMSVENVISENQDTVSAIKQKDVQNTHRHVEEHLAPTLCIETAASSVDVQETVAVPETATIIPTLSTSHEDQERYQIKETCSSESPDFDLLKRHGRSGYEIEIDKNKLQDSFYQSINENSLIQNSDFENEIEIELEEYDDASVLQDTPSHQIVQDEEFKALCEALKFPFYLDDLIENKNGKIENLRSITKKENSDEDHSKKNACVYSTHKKLYPILFPNLQIRINNNILKPTVITLDDFLSEEGTFYKYIAEATKPEINEKRIAPELQIYSQPSGGNSHHPCKDKSGNSMQDSGLTSKFKIPHSSDLSHNSHVSPVPRGKDNDTSSTELSNNTILNEHKCSFPKPKTDYCDTRNKKDMESRVSKRKLLPPFRDQNISHKDLRPHVICGKRRRITSEDSSECFSSLSQGRIKTFSQSERHIRSVLDILNNEASLCKSKRLSRKLNRAVLHLKKAHRKVHTSLQLIAKVGEKRKRPLPKAYEIICNNFWESCDLEGRNSVSERRYSSTKYFLSKRKHNKLREKRAFRYDKSLACVSKIKPYRTNRDRTAVCYSKECVAGSVSRSHTTICVREFFDQEHPESPLPLFSESQSTHLSEYGSNSVKDPQSSEPQPFSGITEGLLYSDKKLIEKENQVDNRLSDDKCKKLENCPTHSNIKDVTKESDSGASEVISESSSVSLNCVKENSVRYSTDKNDDATLITDTRMKTDISALESNVERSVDDIYEQDDFITSGCKKLEIFTRKKWVPPIERYKPSIVTGNFIGLLDLPLTSNEKYSILQLQTTVTHSEEESSKFCLEKQRIFAVDYFATPTTVSHSEQMCGGKELLETRQCSSSNCLCIKGSDTNVTECCELDLTSGTEQSKSCGENIIKLSSNDSSVLLKGNIKDSSKKWIAKKDVKKIEQAENVKDSLKKGSMLKGSVQIDKNQNKILKEESHLNMKTVQSNVIDSHLSIKNTTPEAICLNNSTISSHLNKRKRKSDVEVTDDSRSDCISKSEINYTSFLQAHSEVSKVTTIQKKPTSYMNELKEKHSSANHSALIVQLSQILQRADEASSLQILEEETKACQSILPLFVEAFERKQKCSLEQILISRKLLVEQNLWNNCKHNLKPCAVDTLVELQMVMETIHFIENKKKHLQGEPTFRTLLWYDETLYSELLSRPRGYQLQSSFYPAFQGRLKYNAFCELQNYHNQLIELFAETKKEDNSYYAFLKYKRQMNECEAIMKNCSDCFDFSLSVPFTCGVNFGDSLGDLETLRKSTLMLINSPTIHSYPGKQDHLWIIIEIISSKVNFIKSNESVGIKVSLYGLEHIYFDAAKNLVWNEKSKSFNRKYLQNKNEVILKMNECALSKLQKIYDTLSEDLNSEPTSNIEFKEDTMIASRMSDDLISIENCKLSTLFSHPNIGCISEILDQAKFADLKKLQEFTLRCTDHLEILKKYFQMLQEDNTDDVLITEENVLNMLKSHNHGAIILKPEAAETYIEIAMLSETLHFLKNSMAKKLDNQRFRGMLWFDLSLLPELVHCQEKMASFSFLEDNPVDCLWKGIEAAISERKKDLDIISKYNEAVNCSYALHLFSRELKELSEIKKLLMKSKYSISTYIDFVPYVISINYGNTATELEQNYSQFSTLLKNIMSVPQKDLGKMAHIMKVMKTIEQMKIICAKNAKLTTSFILCQMLHNKRSNFQLKRKEKMASSVKKSDRNSYKTNTSMKVLSTSECMIKGISGSSKKQPIIRNKCEDSQEKEKNTVSSCKNQKVNMKDVTEINGEKSALRCRRCKSRN